MDRSLARGVAYCVMPSSERLESAILAAHRTLECNRQSPVTGLAVLFLAVSKSRATARLEVSSSKFRQFLVLRRGTARIFAAAPTDNRLQSVSDGLLAGLWRWIGLEKAHKADSPFKAAVIDRRYRQQTFHKSQ